MLILLERSVLVVTIAPTDDTRTMQSFLKTRITVSGLIGNKSLMVAELMLMGLFFVGLIGCQSSREPSLQYAVNVPAKFEDPTDQLADDVDTANLNVWTVDFAPPQLQNSAFPETFLDLTIEEVVKLAMRNTKVLRELGGDVLQNPQAASTIFDPAIQSSDPVFGVAAARSAFDTQFNSVMSYANNDSIFNNVLIGGGANEVQQSLSTVEFGFSKFNENGGQLSIRNGIENDSNNRSNNLFNNSWTSVFEAQLRQPLMQGAGRTFNLIAGPNSQPGLRNGNGIRISQVNNNISVLQLERNLVRHLDNVIAQYWRLYFAYENFKALKRARNGAMETLSITKARFDNNLPGGEADREAQAREQLYNFEGRLIVAQSGDRVTGATGVLQAEADLRRLLNLPQTDGQMIRPVEALVVADMAFDWSLLVDKSLRCRVEIREQQQRIKRRELEVVAARNFLMPRVDALASYSNDGFGDDLWGGQGQFPSALRVASDGDYQSFEFGLDISAPVGFRQASAAVRNAELQLTREKSVLEEQKRQIVHDLGSSIRQITQTHASVDAAKQRLNAANQTVESRLVAFEAGAAPFDELLDAQRRLAEAEVNYYRQTSAWAVAIDSISRESGDLLRKYSIFIVEQSPGS